MRGTGADRPSPTPSTAESLCPWPARAPPRRARDRELEAGSLAHYEDPAYYTATYAPRIEDVAYYVQLAEKAGGPVLEYGVGNGRIAIPIARHGVGVVGVDHSVPMLADLRSRLAGESEDVRSRVRVVRGDMRRVRLGERFPLVLATFNTALHLYTRVDVERFLPRCASIWRRAVGSSSTSRCPPSPIWRRASGRPYHAPRFRHPTAGVVVKNREYFDYDPARQVLFVAMEFEPVDEPERGVDDAARAPPVLPPGVGGAAALQWFCGRPRRGRLLRRAAHQRQRRDDLAREAAAAQERGDEHRRAPRGRSTRASRRRRGRRAASPSDVKLIAVSKTKPLEAIREAYACGQRAFGENYAQELAAKAEALADLADIEWHFIGHLQTNKAKFAAKFAQVVHAVDSAVLARELGKRAARDASDAAPVLIEVNVGREPQKAGATPSEIEEVMAAVQAEPSLALRGLMTVPPAGDAVAARRVRDARAPAEPSRGVGGAARALDGHERRSRDRDRVRGHVRPRRTGPLRRSLSGNTPARRFVEHASNSPSRLRYKSAPLALRSPSWRSRRRLRQPPAPPALEPPRLLSELDVR